LIRALVDGLREQGLVDGQTMQLELRWAGDRIEALPALAAELAALPVDVIVTGNNIVTLAAKAATATIPIVMVVGVDPVRAGLIDSFARPGRNVTGMTNEPGQQIFGKMLQLLKEAAPRAERIGVLAQESLGYDRAALADAAARLSLRLLTTPELRLPADLETVFDAMRSDGAQAYVAPGGGIIYSAREQVAALALRHRLPGMHFSADYVRAGGLMSYGTDLPAQWRRAAWYVARILAGAKPAELAVEQPARFETAINLRTARALELQLPQRLLLQATEVIE
jgi:putative ABC transport system substrate-binding protein